MNHSTPEEICLTKEDAALWRHRYKLFSRLYKGRNDVIAERQGDKYIPLEGAGLTFERFLDHVLMKKTYALYNKDDDGCVSFGLFDVDIFPREQGWEKLLLSMDEKKRETTLIMQRLMELGLDRRNMLIEFPTVGFHLLLFFEEPVPAAALKAVMSSVLKDCRLTHLPFYPRKVEEPLGDCVQLPLRINLNTSKRSNFLADLDSFDPSHYSDEPNFSLLEEVIPIESAWVRQITASRA